MYRIFCESYENFIKSFDTNSCRLEVAEPLGLITDVNRYMEEEKRESEIYKKLSDLIIFMQKSIRNISEIKSFFMDFEFKKYKWKRI